MPSEQARAKVNLFLHVLGRRTDGYHLLDSLVVFADVGDVLEAELADELTLSIEGPFASALAGDNLVLHAAEALRRPGLGATLVLQKNLPVASGIGGGSADAAAALRLLNRMWHLGLPPAELAATGLSLGADVPVCLLGEPTRMGGVGDLLGVAPALPPGGMVLVNPGVPISTQAIFGAREASFSEPATLPALWATVAGMAADLSVLTNDLEATAIGLCPAIAEVLAWLRSRPGCLMARMSGSGATCFALFETIAEAEVAAGNGPAGWWCWGGAFG